MGTHMKTTVELADSLVKEARRVAAREGTTLRALIEDGLRRALDDRRPGPPFRLRRCTFKGQGLAPDLAGVGWDAIRERAYEGHGG